VSALEISLGCVVNIYRRVIRAFPLRVTVYNVNSTGNANEIFVCNSREIYYKRPGYSLTATNSTVDTRIRLLLDPLLYVQAEFLREGQYV
jgi:hypothetical protein